MLSSPGGKFDIKIAIVSKNFQSFEQFLHNLGGTNYQKNAKFEQKWSFFGGRPLVLQASLIVDIWKMVELYMARDQVFAMVSSSEGEFPKFQRVQKIGYHRETFISCKSH